MTGHAAASKRARALCAVLVLAATVACGDSSPTTPTPDAGSLAGFTLSGDPTSIRGAVWTYQGRSGGLAFDVEGVLE